MSILLLIKLNRVGVFVIFAIADVEFAYIISSLFRNLRNNPSFIYLCPRFNKSFSKNYVQQNNIRRTFSSLE